MDIESQIEKFTTKFKQLFEAAELAKTKGLFTIGFVNQTGGRLKDNVSLTVQVPSLLAHRIQEMHSLFGALLTSGS